MKSSTTSPTTTLNYNTQSTTRTVNTPSATPTTTTTTNGNYANGQTRVATTSRQQTTQVYNTASSSVTTTTTTRSPVQSTQQYSQATNQPANSCGRGVGEPGPVGRKGPPGAVCVCVLVLI